MSLPLLLCDFCVLPNCRSSEPFAQCLITHTLSHTYSFTIIVIAGLLVSTIVGPFSGLEKNVGVGSVFCDVTTNLCLSVNQGTSPEIQYRAHCSEGFPECNQKY